MSEKDIGSVYTIIKVGHMCLVYTRIKKTNVVIGLVYTSINMIDIDPVFNYSQKV